MDFICLFWYLVLQPVLMVTFKSLPLVSWRILFCLILSHTFLFLYAFLMIFMRLFQDKSHDLWFHCRKRSPKLLEMKETRKQIGIPQGMIKSCYQHIVVNQLIYDPLFHFYNIIESDRFTRWNESKTKEKINISKQHLQVHLLVRQGFFLMT